MAAAWLAAVLALYVPTEQAVAPLGPSHPAVGSRVDLVVRTADELRANELSPLKLLLSDAATDAPVPAKVSLELLGPKGTEPIRGEAGPGDGPGAYLFSARFAQAGRYAVVAKVKLTRLELNAAAAATGFQDILASDGLAVDAVGPSAPAHRSPIWPFVLGVAAALVLFSAVRKRGRPVVAALLLFGAADARAHGAFTPPPAAVPGANVFLAQEIQFALGLRTAPAAVETFTPPTGSEGASRQFIGVPRSAIVERDGHKLLFVRVGPERFVAREPKLGWGDERGEAPRVAVLEGLDLDEKVVTEGAAFLRNGGAAAPEAPRSPR